MENSAKPMARRRRRWKVAAALLGVLVASIAAFPWIAGTRPIRNWLLTRANRALAPGGLDASRFRFSWFGPTVIEGFGLRNARGHRILQTSRAVWDRNLFLVLFDRPRYGTLRLEDARLDIERLPDGKIDLAETLRPVLDGPEATDLTIEIARGTFRLRGKGLVEPVQARDFTLHVHRPPSPEPAMWTISLANSELESLRLNGSYDRWDTSKGARKDLEFQVQALNWPLAIGSDQFAIRTAFSGSTRGELEHGFLATTGNISLANPTVSGPILNGDRIGVGPTTATWDVSQSEAGWKIKEFLVENALDSKTSFGSLRASGDPIRVVGKLDLGAFSREFPHALKLREDFHLDRGIAEIALAATQVDHRPGWTVDLKLSGLAGRAGSRPLSIKRPANLRAQISDERGSLKLASLSLESSFLTAQTRESIAQETAIVGTLDLAAFHREFGDMIDFRGLEPTGLGRFSAALRSEEAKIAVDFHALTFGLMDEAISLGATRIQASARGDLLRSPADASWNLRLDVASAQGPGLSVGPLTIAAQGEPGTVAIEPISTTLNGGTLNLTPELVDVAGGRTLRLGSGSSLRDAEVNEVLSRRVLSFVAPILEGATRARGFVSATIDRAEFPLNPDVASKAVVEGQVVFRNLEFGPGPLASDLLGLLGRGDPTLKLDQPVILSIADGKIRQRGLAIPLGDLTRIELEGTVGFDRSLDLRATLPLTPAMFPNRPLVGDVIGGTRLTLPIGGTLSRRRSTRTPWPMRWPAPGRTC